MNELRRPKIYIAGPLGDPPKKENVKKAITCAEQVWRMGGAPFVPHLSTYWHQLYPHTPREWLELDLEYVKTTDAVFRLQGPSLGSDLEAKTAREYGIPVFTDSTALRNWIERESA